MRCKECGKPILDPAGIASVVCASCVEAIASTVVLDDDTRGRYSISMSADDTWNQGPFKKGAKASDNLPDTRSTK